MKIKIALVMQALAIVLPVTLIPLNATADIAHEVIQQSVTSGYLEANSALQIRRIPIIGADNSNTDPESPEVNLSLGLSGRLEWRGFFIEAVRESSNNGIIGYDAWENENSRVALIITSQLGGYSPGTVTGYESVGSRDTDLQFGIRSTHYTGNNIVQLEALSDISGRDEGVVASAQLGRYWQIRNWNVHALVGARYFSSSTIDYYIGIDADEVSAATPAYQASNGIVASVKVGASLPLTEHWVFRTSLNMERLPDSVVESPLVTARSSYVAEAGFHYVF